MQSLSSPRSPLGGLGNLSRGDTCASKLARNRSSPTDRKGQARSSPNSIFCAARPPTCEQPSAAVWIYISAREWRAVRGRQGPNGSGKRNRRSVESSAALRYVKSQRPASRVSSPPASQSRCSLAFQSRTAALRRAVARSFWLWATAQIGPTEGWVTASARGATAGFRGQMHGRLDARLGSEATFEQATP